MRLKHFLSVFLTLLTLSVGQMWGYTGTFSAYTNATLIDGLYVIGASTSASSNSSYCAGTSVNTGRLTGQSLTTTNPADGIVWIIEETEDGWTFKNYGDQTKYIKQTSTTSGKGMSVGTTVGYFTLAGYNSSSPVGYRFTSSDQNSTNFFKYNAGSKWFSNYANAYSTSMTPVTLYRVAKFRAKTTQPATGSFTASASSATWDNTNKHLSWMASGATVSLTATPPSGKEVDTWTVTKAHGGTVTVSNNQFSMPEDQVTITVTWKNATPAYTITPATNDENKGTVSILGNVITGSPKSGYRYASPAYTVTSGTATVSQSGDAFTVTPSTNCTITINFEAIPTHTIHFNTGGLVNIADATGIKEGETYNITQTPAASLTENCEYGTFVGWTTASSIADASVSPSIITSYTMSTSDVTLHAVYSKTIGGGGPASLTKLGSTYAPAEGDNLVIVEQDNSYALYRETSGTYVSYWSFSNSAATVGADTKNYVTLESDGESGWYLGDATNGYVYNGSSNNLIIDTDNHTSFSITWNSTGFNIVGNSRWLSCRTDVQSPNTNKYRMGGATSGTASGSALFDLYKYTSGSAGTTTYSLDANCCDPLGSINGSISLSQSGNDLVADEWNATTGSNETGYLVKLYNSTKSAVIASGNTEGTAKTYTFTNPGAGTYWVSVTPTFSGDGNFCEAGEETFSASSITLTGKVVVTFKLNDGTVEGGVEKTQEVTANEATPLTSIATLGYIAPACKEFGGWASSEENANAETPVVAYADGASITATEATVLWAIWKTKTFAVTDGTIDASVASHSFSNTVACGSDLTITCTAAAAYKGNPTVTATGTHGEITVNSATSVTIANVQSDIAVSIAYETAKANYAITWSVAGEALTGDALDGVTTSVLEGSAIENLPSVADNAVGACANKFMGWSKKNYNTVPKEASDYDDLFNDAAGAPEISEATTFYAVFAKNGIGDVIVTDVLDREFTGRPKTSDYGTWSEKSGTASDAVYAGQSAGDHDAIQLRSNNNNSGVITTTSGGKAKKVTITWNSNTAATRTITIYGKNTAYTAATDLYGDNKGTSLGDFNVDNAVNSISTLTITEDYKYIGIRSKSGALYLDEVDIQWETTGTTLTDYVTECPAVVAPTFDTAEGTYNAAQTVKISNYNSDYLYFYTTDNSDPAADANLDPTGTSAVYDNATGIAINGSCTLKAVAYNEDIVASAINSAAYVLKVATPEISGNTSFVNSATVTITATGADAIYYTDDDSDPTTESTLYTEPFVVSATKTIKAIAVKANWTNSEIASQTFTKVTPLTVATALSNINALDNNGTIADQYVKGLISQIVSYNSGNTITYYISDDGTTTSQLQVYKGSAGVANGGNAFTSADDLKVGEEVIVSGTLKKYVSGNKTTPEFVNPNEIVAYKPFAPMAWSANAYTAELGGSSNVFPSLSGTAGLTISYSSSDETVAEISADGTTYNLKKVGSTTITATSEANASYVATSKSYTLTVEAAVTRYSLSYVKNGGTSDATDSEGETETNLPNPLPTITKAGYNFGGWYTDNTFETPAVAGAALTENTTIYAQWLEPYTVAQALMMIDALDDNGTTGNVYVAGVVTDDEVSVSSKTATYYIKDADVDNSLEVYKGKGLNNADVTAGDIQEGDQLVVYGQLMKYKGYSATAKPEIVNPNYIYSQVRPTYDVTGVTVASTANVRAGKTITLTATIEPANATDKAVTWSSDAEGVATVDENGVVTGVAEGTAHITVTTHDGEFQATCTVTVAGALPTFTEDDHEWIKISNASKLVAGRFYVIGESSKGVTATNDLSGGYLAKASTIITDGVIASGTLGANTAIFELGGNSTDGWTLYELTDEENTGYLSGTDASDLSWSASAATTSISFDESGNAILGNANGYRVLYNSNSPRFKGYSSDLSTAMLLPQLYMWAELSHSVTFDANGGVAESVPDVERTDEGKIIIPATEPTHSDISKAFAGWYKSDAPATLYNAGDEFETNVDVTLYAKWNSVPTYTVTYVPGGAGTVPAVTSYREGQKVQVEEASLSNPGYSFAGWTVKDADQNVLPLDEENKFDMPASNVTITAVWSRISSQKWNLVKQGETLEIDAEYVIAYYKNDTKKALGAISSNIGTAINVTIDGEILKGSDAMKVLTLKAGNGVGNYAFLSGSKYLTWSSGNTLNESDELSDASSWTIEIDENNEVDIKNVGTTTRYLQYNAGSPRFACYTDSQQKVRLYKKAASVVINNEQTVNAAGITANADVTIKNGGTLNVNADKQIGDLTVENGGKVTLSNKLTVVGTFTIETTMASGESGQLSGASTSNFEAAEAYIDITFGAGGTNQQWHAFTVPFPVDAMNGIYDLDGNKLTNEVNYAIMDYHGDIRAKGQYGWKKYRGVLVPGTFYIMATDGYRTTYRFKKKAGEALVADNSKEIFKYAKSGDGQDTDAGWNGIGNPNLFYGKVNLAVQVLDPMSYTFVTKTAQSTNFVVGTPFFYQATANGSMVMETANAGGNYAPARERAIEIKDVPVSFGNEDFNDYLYVTANEDALNTYETGKDLVKMTMTNTPKVAQIFGKAYNTKLCMVHAPMVNDQAEVALELYAPQAGIYTISVPAEREDASLYLTKDGNIIWDLTMSPYEAEFDKGQNNGYGLMLVRKAPQVTTGMETVDNSQSTIHNCQKVILNDHVYILRDAQLYDVTGKAVK